MPLLFLVGQRPVMVRLRSAARDAAAGLERDLEWLLRRLREAWPRTRIIVRTDAGFCREEVMALCEGRQRVDYVLGLGSNPRLQAELAAEREQARARARAHGRRGPALQGLQLPDARELDAGAAGGGQGGSAAGAGCAARQGQPALRGDVAAGEVLPGAHLYENFYCARGNAENRVKEHKVHLFSKRCSCNLFDANALRLYFSTFALLLFRELREALRGTAWRGPCRSACGGTCCAWERG